MSEFRLKEISINNSRITFYEGGKGIPILCIPPWPCDGYSFKTFFELVGDKYRVIAINNSYLLKSSDTEFDLSRYIKSIQDLVSTLNLKDYVLLGYSYGAFTSVTALHSKKLKPKKFILVSPFVPSKNFKKQFNRKIKLLYYLQKFLPRSITRLFIYLYCRIYLKYMMGSYKNQNSRKVYKNSIPQVLGINYKNAVKSVLDISKLEIDQSFYKLELPTLLLYSKNDHPLVLQEIPKFQISDSVSSFAVGDSDHNHFALDPSLVIEKIKKFIPS
jgi:pimeloyl-ACP methyl ester carboxylesterase